MVDVVVNDVMATSMNLTDLSTYMFKKQVSILHNQLPSILTCMFA